MCSTHILNVRSTFHPTVRIYRLPLRVLRASPTLHQEIAFRGQKYSDTWDDHFAQGPARAQRSQWLVHPSRNLIYTSIATPPLHEPFRGPLVWCEHLHAQTSQPNPPPRLLIVTQQMNMVDNIASHTLEGPQIVVQMLPTCTPPNSESFS